VSRTYVPRPWQPAMIEHVCERARAGQWAGMGTGKTSATLAAMDILHLTGDLTQPALVIAPLRVAEHTWPDECAKWGFSASWSVEKILGSPADRLNALGRVRRGNSPLATINYDNLPWLIEKLEGAWPFGMVIADESTKLKSFRGGFQTHPTSGKVFYRGTGSVRAKAIGRVAHRTPRWVNLTGTPAPNGLIDLWGQTWMLDAGQRLGRTFESFKERWFQRSFDGHGLDPLPFAQEQIETALQGLCLTTEVEVEDHIKNVILVELPPKARSHYREMERKMWTELKSVGIEAVNAAARTGKCLQIANGAVYDNEEEKAWHELHDVKITALESIVEEAAGAPVLVAYHWRHDLVRLLRAFPGAIDLSTSAGLRRAKGGEGRVWLAHPASLGHGVDGLQEHSHQLAFFGLNWNLEEHDQIIERVGPMRQQQAGKHRQVFVHYIVAEGTVDELVMDRLESKRTVQQVLLDAMKRRDL
jgi:SNF2 family DNA or RNA helicase